MRLWRFQRGRFALYKTIYIFAFFSMAFLFFSSSDANPQPEDSSTFKVTPFVREELIEIIKKKEEAYTIRNDVELGRLYWGNALIELKAYSQIDNYNRDDFVQFMFRRWNSDVKEYGLQFVNLECNVRKPIGRCVSVMRERFVYSDGIFIYSCSKHEDTFTKLGETLLIVHSFIDNDFEGCSKYFKD